MADIRAAIQPRSDQLNFVDFMAGPAVFTVERTEDYRDEKGQPRVAVHMVERPGRPFKASATNLRLIAIGWGDSDSEWPGRRIKLGGDPEVTFGREKVGGIRVLALSDLPQPFTAKLPITRGKKQEFRVEVLADEVPAPSIPSFETVDEARAHYQRRKAEGATQVELDAIRAAAPTEKEPA